MDITSKVMYVEELEGFQNAWMEMYDKHVVSVAHKIDIVENSVVECSSEELQEMFEHKYDCKLTQRSKGHHYWYEFDSVQFNSDSAHTMFLLKWS